MSRFAAEAHFVLFLDLSPRSRISGGKVVGREKRRTKNRAGLALWLAAGTLLESGACLGARYRRLRAKRGVPKAGKAMANRHARIACRMLKYGEEYADKEKEFYERNIVNCSSECRPKMRLIPVSSSYNPRRVGGGFLERRPGSVCISCHPRRVGGGFLERPPAQWSRLHLPA
jgi:hypothetical protein